MRVVAVEGFLSQGDTRTNRLKICPVDRVFGELAVDVVHHWNDRRKVRS